MLTSGFPMDMQGDSTAKFASGTQQNTNMTTKYTVDGVGSAYISYVEINGLDFQPYAVFLSTSAMAMQGISLGYTGGVAIDPEAQLCALLAWPSSSYTIDNLKVAKAYVEEHGLIENGIRVPVRSDSSSTSSKSTYYWFAIGA